MNLQDEHILKEIKKYLAYKENKAPLKQKVSKKNLVKLLKCYFKENYVSIRELPQYKKILEEKINANHSNESNMLIWFNLFKGNREIDEYFVQSWQELWKYANEKEIYETETFLANYRALEMIRGNLVEMTSSEDKKPRIHYETCFKTLEEEDLKTFIEFLRYFDYLKKENHQTKSMLEKIMYANWLLEIKEKTLEKKLMIYNLP